MNLKTAIKLNSGEKMPVLGLGTWELNDEDAYNAVALALSLGVRHIDTATIYRNEAEVGKAIKHSGIPREELFITTKVWNSDQGFDSTLEAFDESLNKLEVGYIDLYLIHWPVEETRVETYKALEQLYESGQARSIGVSNFMVKHLRDLAEKTEVKPAVNQFELHPFNNKMRKDVVGYCHENGIAVTAYSPIAKAAKLDNEVLKEIAERHDKSVPQVMIRWSLQKGNIVIPRSSNPHHIEENFDVFDFKLSDEEMARIDELDESYVVTTNPDKFD